MIALLAQQPGQAVGTVLFFVFAAMACLSAWALVLSQNVVRMAVYLLATLGGVAGLYLLLGAELIAAIQLIVYVGGTLILILFGVMLTNQNPLMQVRVHKREALIGVAIAVTVAAGIISAAVASPMVRAQAFAAGESPDPTQAGQGYSSVQQIGVTMLTDYVAAFELAAVLLLVVMIAAAYMARRRVHSSTSQADSTARGADAQGSGSDGSDGFGDGGRDHV